MILFLSSLVMKKYFLDIFFRKWRYLLPKDNAIAASELPKILSSMPKQRLKNGGDGLQERRLEKIVTANELSDRALRRRRAYWRSAKKKKMEGTNLTPHVFYSILEFLQLLLTLAWCKLFFRGDYFSSAVWFVDNRAISVLYIFFYSILEFVIFFPSLLSGSVFYCCLCQVHCLTLLFFLHFLLNK